MADDVEVRHLDEVRAVPDGAPRLAGYAIRTNVLSEPLGDGTFTFRERIEPDAVRRALEANRDILCLHNHDTNRILGRTPRTLRIQADERGLAFELDVPAHAMDVFEAVQRGDAPHASFAFTNVEDSWDTSTTPPTRTIRSLRIRELSLAVPWAAYPQTSVSVARRSLDAHTKEPPVETPTPAPVIDLAPPVPPIPPETRDVEVVGESRVLKPADSFRSFIEREGKADPQYARLTFGALVRSMITGPRTDLERRALAEGADASGGITVPDLTLSRFIDRLRAAMVVMRAGAQTVPLTSDRTTIATLATDVTIAWRNENQEITAADPTFGSVVFTPRSLGSLVRVSRELVEDSLNIEQMLERSFAETMAREVDRVALVGSGIAPEPRGIAATPNITTTAVGGAFTSWDQIIDGLYKLWAGNVSTVTGIVMHPRTFTTAAKFKQATELSPMPVPPAVSGIPLYPTTALSITQAPGTATTVIAGDFTRLLLGIRSSMRLEILRERYGEFLQLGFLAHLRMDVAVEQPAAFHTWTGIVP